MEAGEPSFWALCIDYLEAGSKVLSTTSSNSKPSRVDYKEILSPDEFSRFSALRTLRKQLAAENGVPVYSAMTNEQIARIVQDNITKQSDLRKVPGLGEAKVEKYGDPIISVMKATERDSDEVASHLFERIADRENLRHAFHRAARGKRDRLDVRIFARHLEQSLLQLRVDLLHGRLELGRSSTFTICDPKPRTITAPCFREWVSHHAIIRVREPVFEKFLIPDTFACRVSKGRIAALHRAMHFSARFNYVIKLDIRKYFDSIYYQELLARLKRRYKDRRLLGLFRRIVCSHTGNGRALPIGSLTSQHFANFYLGWFDRFVKERLGVQGYVR